MKKIIALLLALSMCFTLCACATAENETPETTESTDVELTTENISQYLNIVIGEPVRVDDWIFTTPMEIYSLQPGDFANVEIVLSIKTHKWSDLSSAVGATLETDEEAVHEYVGTLTCKLPADGRHKIDINVWAHYGWESHADIEEYTLVSISGTFIPNN